MEIAVHPAGPADAASVAAHDAPRRSGYVFVEIEIHDRAAYRAEYVPRALAAVARYGGRFLHSGKDVVTKAGDLTGRRIVLIEFGCFDDALAFHDSPDYQEAIRHRDAHATVHRYYLMPADPTS